MKLLDLLMSILGIFKTPLNASAPGKVYGWVKDIEDPRDYLFTNHYSFDAKKLPVFVDMTAYMPPVFDQGNLGSCTANAICAHVQFLHMQSMKDSTMLSRLYLYFKEREMEQTINEDAGAMIRDGIKCVDKFGICAEALMQYDVAKFKQAPNAAQNADAIKREISIFSRIKTLAEMKQCLADGFPFVFGFQVYESFESDAVASNGIMPMPKKGERCLGGHAIMAVGYNDKTKMFKIRNSWGSGWGDKGYFYMPYDFITNANYTDDFWTIRK